MRVEFRAFQGHYDWGYVCLHCPIKRCEDTNGIVAVDMEKNQTVGMIVFDNWTKNAVTAHIIVTNPMVLRHGFLEEAFDFAFNVSDRKIIMGQLRSDNKKAYKIDMNMGFKEVLRIKDGFEDGVDTIIVQMNKEDCRFIKHEEIAV